MSNKNFVVKNGLTSSNILFISPDTTKELKLQILNSGNLLFGTETDDGINKLQINGSLSISSLTSTVATGTAPFVVASTTKVTNLNADLLNGQSGSYYSPASHVHAESTLTFTDITTNNATTTKHGFLPKLTGDTSKYLRADGTWADVDSGGIIINSAAPGTPTDSTLWWNSETGDLNLYYNDGNSNQWVTVNGKGVKGDKGDIGLTGPANSLSVGTVTAGETPSVSITGTAPSQIINFVLPDRYLTIDDLLPSQTANSGNFLTTNGTTVSWKNITGKSIAMALIFG